MYDNIQPSQSRRNRSGATFAVRCALGLALMASASVAGARVFAVTNLNDSGPGSLREAIASADETRRRGADYIYFRVSGTLTLASTLPAITDPAGLVLDGDGRHVSISGNHAVRLIQVNAGAKLELKNLTLADGLSADVAGGSGIANEGFLTIINSTFSGHSASFEGGAVNNGGTMTIRGSTFSANRSTGYYAGNGGAIKNRGTADVSNSTFYGNAAAGYLGKGGAISNSGQLSIVHGTFLGNSVADFGDPDRGGAIENGATLRLANTLLAGSTNISGEPFANCASSSGPIDLSGVNWSSDDSCGFAGGTGDALLGPLADNGGPTQTLALLSGSPAIDAADDAVWTDPPMNRRDQRGIRRPQGGHCDIGAFEASVHEFSGFKPPLGNPPLLNEVQAGRTVPLKFTYDSGGRGPIFQPGYPLSKPIDCTTDEIIDEAPVRSVGFPVGGRHQYVFPWKTDTAWAGTCRQFQILFTDGRFGQANFSFQ